jgi:hypothetical protein
MPQINYKKQQDYPNLISAIGEGCVLFVGAGLSRAAHGFPTWDQMVKRIAHKFPVPENELIAIEEYRLEYLAWCNRQDGALLKKTLDDLLKQTPRREPSPLHECLSSVAWAAIITTNYDSLIEDAFTAARRPFFVVDREKAIARTGLEHGTMIVKMHGSLNAELVLTASEYERFDLEQHAMKALVIMLLAQYPTMFLGTGLSDPNFNRLYSVVRHNLGVDTRPRYYVSNPLPGFVKDYWRDLYFRFIEVDHSDLLPFVKDLVSDVRVRGACLPLHRGRRTVSMFAKENALDQLAAAGGDWNRDAYGRLQDQYTAFIQMQDYGSFSQEWEDTLYQPLRAFTIPMLDRCPPGTRFAYVAPGPHAPLFNDSEQNRRIDDNIGEIVLIDISRSVLRMAKWHIQQHWKNRSASIVECKFDVTGDAGSEWAGVLGKLLAAGTLNEIGSALDSLLAPGRYIGTSDDGWSAATGWDQLGGPFDFIYSEMIASFTGTAPLMAFETLTRRIFAQDNALDHAVVRIRDKVRLLWQRYNEVVYQQQLRLLARQLAPGGTMVVAFDVEKKYLDSRRPSVYSFTGGTPPKLPSDLGLRMSRDTGNPIWWLDHPEAFAVTENTGGHEDDYFLPHHHRVEVLVYEKARDPTG